MTRRRPSRSRTLLVAAALGGTVVLGLGTAAFAQYGPGPTTTSSSTTTSSTSSTSSTSTTSTTTGSTTTSIGANPGTTIASGSGNGEEPTVSLHTTTPGSTLTVSIASQFGGAAIGNQAKPAPCGAGVPVTVYLQLLQDGSAPVKIGNGVSNAAGGLDPIQVKIPTTVPLGTYVLFAQCTNADGILEILTSPLVLVGAGAHVAIPHAFTTSASFGTPAEQAAVNTAVRGQVARAASAGASGLPNGGLQLIAPRLGLHNDPGSSSAGLFAGLAAAVVALVALGLLTLRRQHVLAKDPQA